MFLIGWCSQVTLISFTTYVLMDPNNKLDAEKAFVSLALFNLLRFPMSVFPMLVVAFVQVNCRLQLLVGSFSLRSSCWNNQNSYFYAIFVCIWKVF